MVENIVRKGEIACYKQFLLFSQCFLQLSLVCQNAALCGNGLKFEGLKTWEWIWNMIIIANKIFFHVFDGDLPFGF